VRLPYLLRSPASEIASQYASAVVAAGKTPWRLANFCVVDLELSGLDSRHDEIVSYAAVPVDFGRVIVGGALYGLCKPTRPLVEPSVLVHGIRTVDVADALPLDEAIQPIIAAMTGRVTVAHVAWVERSFLSSAFKRQGIRLREPVLDTNSLGRLLAFERGAPSPPRSLTQLAQSLNLPVHRQHNALGDALTTAQVFIALATHLDEFSPETVQTLARADERTRLYKV
jgi:DNA polymerase-3 subunit epsilon